MQVMLKAQSPLTNFEMTQNEIAEFLGITNRAVSKRLKKFPELIARRESNGGRPQLYFDAQRVLALYGLRLNGRGELEKLINYQLPTMSNNDDLELSKPRKERADRGEIRNKYFTVQELQEITEIVKHNYLNQAIKDNLSRITMDAIICKYPQKSDAEINKMHNYLYKRYLTLENNTFLGPAKAEKWQELWREKWQKNKMNSSNAMLQWAYCEIFENNGWAGKGSGTNLFWVIDATQYDGWTSSWNKSEKQSNTGLPSFLLIMDGITGMPLWARPLANGESIEAAAAAVIECAMIYGAPKYGFILDNGKAFKAPRFQSLLKKLCPVGRLTLDELKILKIIFPKSEAPIYYPLAKIPRFPFKAKLERLFGELNKFPAVYSPLAYQGGTDRRRVQIELGSTPVLAMKSAPSLYEAFYEFMNFLFFEFGSRSSTTLSRHFKQKGLASINCPLRAFEYYGGNIGNVMQVIESGVFPERPELSGNGFEYYLTSESDIKRVKSTAKGAISLTIGGERVNLLCDKLTIDFLNEKIAVIPYRDGSGWSAKLYLERQENKFHHLTPNAGDVYYIGEATDGTIREISEIPAKRALRSKIQKANEKRVKELTEPKIELTDYVLLPDEPKALNAVPEYFENVGAKAPENVRVIETNLDESDAQLWDF